MDKKEPAHIFTHKTLRCLGFLILLLWVSGFAISRNFDRDSDFFFYLNSVDTILEGRQDQRDSWYETQEGYAEGNPGYPLGPKYSPSLFTVFLLPFRAAGLSFHSIAILLKIFNFLSFLGALYLFKKYLNRRLGGWIGGASIVTMLFVFTVNILPIHVNLFSGTPDMMSLFLIMLALYQFRDFKFPRSASDIVPFRRNIIIFILISTLAFLLKPTAVPLFSILAIVVWVFIYQRKRLGFILWMIGLLALVTVAAYTIFRLGYVGVWLHNFSGQTLIINFFKLIALPAEYFVYPFAVTYAFSGTLLAAGVSIYILAIKSIIKTGRSAWHLIIFAASYFIVLLIWPFPGELYRLGVPLVLIIWAFAVVGVRNFFIRKDLFIFQKNLERLVLAYLLFALMGSLLQAVALGDRANWYNYQEGLDLISIMTARYEPLGATIGVYGLDPRSVTFFLEGLYPAVPFANNFKWEQAAPGALVVFLGADMEYPNIDKDLYERIEVNNLYHLWERKGLIDGGKVRLQIQGPIY